MSTTIYAIEPAMGTEGLVVEIHPELSSLPDDLIAAFSRRLFNRSVRVGLAVTPVETRVVRDESTSTSFSRDRFEVSAPLSTIALFGAADLAPPGSGEHFVVQVRTWLEAIAASWQSFMDRSAVGVMVPDVVGHLVDADLVIHHETPAAPDAAE
jgi:hypothetical protein